MSILSVSYPCFALNISGSIFSGSIYYNILVPLIYGEFGCCTMFDTKIEQDFEYLRHCTVHTCEIKGPQKIRFYSFVFSIYCIVCQFLTILT